MASILNNRAETINFSSLNDYYEFIGYLCTPNRVVSIDAEVPSNLVKQFLANYPKGHYRIKPNPVTPSGLPKKFGAQFRINLRNITNHPLSISKYLKRGTGTTVVKRINKSKLVEDLVLNHGFVFGNMQNVTHIKSLVPKQYVTDFDKGYNL
ncbi:MAG: hypothetical protein JEZ05_04815 [Tenericutes bacterium]|nr:hypothetical protein [Mycoplasmatota bacterium]